MKSIKYLVWSLILVAGGVFTACTEDGTYQPAEKEGNTVYFAAGTATISVSEQTSADISVLRSDDSEAATVALTVSADDVLTVPTSVSFAAGSKEAKLTVSFDPEALEYDEDYTAELTIADPESTSLYGASTITVTVTRPAPWVSLGMGLFYDSFIFYDPYEVEFQQNQLYPTNFRLVAPYTEGLQNEEEGYDYDGLESPYLNFYLMKPGNKLNETSITKEGLVYFDRTRIFYHPNYDDHVWAFHPSEFTNFQTEESWSYNTVISWQDDAHTLPAVIELAPYYYIPGVGGWNQTTSPTITIVFPGVVLADYSVEIELAGYFKSLEEENFAVVDVTLGEDVEEVKLASAEGNDVDAILNAIINGSIETVSVKADGAANLPVVDGKNTVVAVSYGDGEPQEYDYITFSFYAGVAPEISPLEQDWTFDDIYEIEKEELFKTWTMYCNWYSKYDDERIPMADVTFAESDLTDEYESDFIEVTGLTLGIIEDDTILWEYYEGFVFNIDNGLFPVDDGEYLGFLNFSSSTAKLYGGDWGIIGGLVDDGYMAFVDNETGVKINGYGLYAYGDPDGEDALGGYGFFYNLMLEDPELAAEEGSAEAKVRRNVKLNELKSLAVNMAAPANYVELRGRERAHALIDELKANKKQSSVEPKIEVIARKGSRISKEMTVSASPVMLK